MKKTIWIAMAIISFTSCNQSTEKTAYVNNTKVVSDFNEMKEIQDKWAKRNDEVREELEEKAKQFQNEVQVFQSTQESMSKDKKEKQQQELIGKQQELQREQQTKMQEIQQGSQAEIDSVINKVKDFIIAYGKKNKYTYIYGETEVNNILYAKEGLDLTDEIIKELNRDSSTEDKK